MQHLGKEGGNFENWDWNWIDIRDREVQQKPMVDRTQKIEEKRLNVYPNLSFSEKDASIGLTVAGGDSDNVWELMGTRGIPLIYPEISAER